LTISHPPLQLSRLYLVTDRTLCAPRELVEVLEEACAAGVRMIQLREKNLPARDLYQLAVRVKSIADRYESMLFINDRVDVARSIGAAGVHLPASGLPIAAARDCLSENQLVGVSTHSLEEAILAERDGADFICFGPVFETPSKRRFGAPQGLEKLRAVCCHVSLPVFAIGGISVERVAECMEAGAFGVAVISAIMAAKAPTPQGSGLPAGEVTKRVEAFLEELQSFTAHSSPFS